MLGNSAYHAATGPQRGVAAAIEHRVSTFGAWTRVLPGVYADALVAPSLPAVHARLLVVGRQRIGRELLPQAPCWHLDGVVAEKLGALDHAR